MTNRVRLSIIIPFYNVERYIAQCLESVFHQDLPDSEYEVICVDDCSPDGSLEIVNEFAIVHKNLRIVQNAVNRKLGGARNAGLEVASGEYVLFVDSDDFLKENSLASLCSIAERNDLDIIHFDYEAYPEQKAFHKSEDSTVMSGAELFFSGKFVWYDDLITVWRKIYRRAFLVENGIRFAEHIMFEDNDYSILAFAKAKRVMHVAKEIYYYRSNPDSITRASVSVSHILYWLSLCHRLAIMKKSFMSEDVDIRFQTIIDRFIRYLISHVFDVYQLVPAADKNTAKKMIRRSIDGDLYGYMSKRRLLYFFIGVY